jgi:Domain of unknown function (DUF4389)
MEAGAAYPVTLAVDYPERQSRWKTLLRLFLLIPLVILGAILSYGLWAIIAVTWIAVLVRGRMPRWMFDAQVALHRWTIRAISYSALLTDNYPPFDGEHPVRFDVEYPDRVSRRKLVIWKCITSIPHLFVLQFLWLAALFCTVIGWFAILIVGRFPKGLHGFVGGVLRWQTRVNAYAISLRDEFPPFSLSSEAGPAGRDTYIVSSVIGCLLGAGFVAMIVAAVIVGRQTVRVTVPYDDLTAGRVSSDETLVKARGVDVSLVNALDPADDAFSLLTAQDDKRLVAFWFELDNESGHTRRVWDSDFALKDSDGKWHNPLLAVAGGRPTPVKFGDDTLIEAVILFEIGDDAKPEELRYSPHFLEGKRIIYEFE